MIRGLLRAYPWVPAVLAGWVLLCWYKDPAGPGRVLTDLLGWLSPANVLPRWLAQYIPGGGHG